MYVSLLVSRVELLVSIVTIRGDLWTFELAPRSDPPSTLDRTIAKLAPSSFLGVFV